MIAVDAECRLCGRPIRWIPLTPRVCGPCLRGEARPDHDHDEDDGVVHLHEASGGAKTAGLED